MCSNIHTLPIQLFFVWGCGPPAANVLLLLAVLRSNGSIVLRLREPIVTSILQLRIRGQLLPLLLRWIVAAVVVRLGIVAGMLLLLVLLLVLRRRRLLRRGGGGC